MSPRTDERLGPEFSRPIPVARLARFLGKDEAVERMEASEAERAALARRLGLLSLERLAAVVRVGRPAGGPETGPLIEVAGHFEADVTQACVVTLAPLPREVAGDFRSLYTLEPSDPGDGGPVVVDAGAEDPPEPVGPGGLDLGEAVVQHLAVALDPYPRAGDASVEALDWGGREAGEDTGDAVRESPFKGLELLTRRR